ncbi:MAG: TonB-dependent receptor [Bacteroidota bacterium]
MKRIWSFTLAVMLLFTLISHAQTKISGVVKDAESGDILAGASVQIEGTNTGSTTNSEGRFVLDNVKDNFALLRISYIGYETVVKKVGSDNASNVNIELYKKEIYSKQIVVTANRNEQMIGDIAGRVGLISARELNSKAKRSIDDVLKTSAAVHSDRTSGLFSHPSTVGVRGITAGEQGRVLALIDGQPINKTDGGTVNWNRINPEGIERIEIFKGPGSSVYGNNAMGGVINFISKKAAKEGCNGFIELNASQYNTFEQKVSVSGKLQNTGGLSFRVSGFNRTSDGYNTTREEFRFDEFYANSDLKEYGVDAKFAYEFNDNTNLQLNYSFFDDKRGQGTKVRENNIMTHKTNYAALSFNTKFSDVKLSLNTFFQMEDYLRVMERYRTAGSVFSSYDLIDVDANRDDFGANVNVTIPLDNMLVTAGVELKRGKIDGSDVYRLTYDSASKTYKPGSDVITNKGFMTTLAAFINDDWKINNKLKVSAGLRFDNVKFTDGEYILTNLSKSNEFLKPFAGKLKEYNWFSFTPKLSAQYSFGENLKAYAAYSQGFRAATLDDLTRPGLIRLGFKNANPNLQPERIENIELGLNYDVNQSLFFMPSFYYMTGSNYMAFLNTGQTVNVSGRNRPIIVKSNISKVRIVGGDIDVRYFLSANINIYANFALTKTKILEHTGNTALTGKELTYTPNQLANFGFSYLNEYVNASFNIHYQGKKFLNDDNSENLEVTDKFGNKVNVRMIIEANAAADLKLWKKLFNMVNISLEVQNIFDVQTLSTYDRYSLGRFVTAGVSVDL